MQAGAEPLGYHAVRLRWCRLALRRFVQRWGVYFVITGVLFGAGASSPVAVVAGLTAWVVTPLFHASTLGAWLLPASLLQGLFGAACLWGLRGLLWPASWGDAERALPIEARARRWSDAVVVAIGLLPWLLLCAAGAVVVLGHDPAWLRPTRGRAVLALAAALLLSWALGMLMLQRLRAPPAFRAVSRRPAGLRWQAGAAGARGLSWARALLWLPLWRGPAQRTGHVALLGIGALLLPGAVLGARPGLAPWALAAFAGVALVVVSRVHALARVELTPLFDGCAPLPLAPLQLQRGRSLLALAPLLPGLVALLAGLRGVAVRPWVLAAYVGACVVGCAFEAFAAPAEAADKSARWLFTLVLGVVLATEVVA